MPTAARPIKTTRSMGTLFTETLGLYTQRFKTLLIIILVCELIPTLLTLLTPQPEEFTTQFGIMMLLSFVASIFFGPLLALSIVRVASAKKTVTPVQALRFALSKYWNMLGTSLLAGIMLIGLFILLIIPGVIFAVYWTFVIPVIVVKGLGGKKALDYSKSVVKGRWWFTVGYGLLLGLALFIPILFLFLLLLIFPDNIGTAIFNLGVMIAYAFYYIGSLVLFLELDKTKITKKNK